MLAEQKIQEQGTVEIGWLEEGLREALMQMGTRLMGEMLTSVSDRDIPSDQRRELERRHRRTRTLHTVMGVVEFERDYYWCPECTRIPFDEELGIQGEAFSPGTRKMMGYAASQGSYMEASEDLRRLAGLHISDHSIQREVQKTAGSLQAFIENLPPEKTDSPLPVLYVSLDGTGAPMRKEVLEGRKGKQADGSAKTREVKVGCIYDQPKGAQTPQRASYIANFSTAEAFGADLLREARRRGLGRATTRVVLGDGAHWIWELARINFPGSIEILDYYHATEHLHELIRSMLGSQECSLASVTKQWEQWLWDGAIPLIIQEAQRLLLNAVDRETAKREIEYFRKNITRMKYELFRQSGLDIGSGRVEAACRTVVGERLKRSGMFWSLPGAENILTFRCAVMNHQYDDFWEQYRAA